MRILIVEDEPDLLDALKKQLQSSGYSVDAEDYLKMATYDAVVLDIMLPGIDGLTLLKKMRAEGNTTHVLLLTALDSIENKVNGLDAGADDYLVKPFAYDELLARLRVLLRRRSGQTTNVLEYGGLVMDLNSRTVTRDGTEITLSSKEFAVLEYLLRNPGRVLSRDKIENHVWNYDFEGGSNVVDVYIRYLRKKIDNGFNKKLLHTIRGAGYVLREEK